MAILAGVRGICCPAGTYPRRPLSVQVPTVPGSLLHLQGTQNLHQLQFRWWTRKAASTAASYSAPSVESISDSIGGGGGVSRAMLLAGVRLRRRVCGVESRVANRTPPKAVAEGDLARGVR